MSRRGERRLALRLSYLDGILSTVMIGTAETFAIYYAIKAGLGVRDVGLISTLPILLGAIAQWVIPLWIGNDRLKQAVMASIGIQVLGLFGLYASVGSPRIGQGLLVSLSLYWIGGMLGGPLWLDWISGWLPHKRFTRYLSKRSAILAFTTLAAYLVAARFVYQVETGDIFRALFAVGMVARLLSWAVIARQPSPTQRYRNLAVDVRPQLWHSRPVLIMVAATSLFKLAANISSPFFTPYMLNDLHFGLPQYVLITAIPFVGRFLFLSRWGEAAKSIRPFIGLQISLVGISLSPMLWTLTRDIRWLTSFEFVSGIMWGGFDLCTVLIVQNFWPGSARRLLGAHLALMSLAALVGSSIGSTLFGHGWSYNDLFMLSSNVRFACAAGCILWVARLRETRTPLRVYGDFLSTVMSLRPSLANVGRLVPLRRSRRVPRPTRAQLRSAGSRLAAGLRLAQSAPSRQNEVTARQTREPRRD